MRSGVPASTLAAGVLFVLSPAAAQPPPAVEAPYALIGATVIPGTGEPPLPDGVILVGDDGRIRQVGKRGDVVVPEGWRAVDCVGKWITPGLIDTNVHLILMTVPEFFVKYEDRLADIAVQSAQVGLKYGMTTMADTWGPLAPLLEARERIERGEVEGSRVLIAGNIVGTGGPFSPYFMGGWDIRDPTLRYGGWVHPQIRQRIDALWEDDVGPRLLAMTPEEVGAAIRDYIAKGIDFLKVAVSGHGIGPVEPLLFSRVQLDAIRKEAARAGIPFQTHTFSVESLRLAVEVGPDLLQHPNVMSVPWHRATPEQRRAIEALIGVVADRGIHVGLMAIPHRNQMRVYQEWDVAEHPEEPFLNRIMLHRREGLAGIDFETRAEGVRVWLEAGVRFTLATDQGPEASELGPVVWGRLGRAHFERLEALQALGVDPMEILIAATRNGAQAYGLGAQVGTLEAGKVADLLVLDRDPLADISHLRRIHRVIHKGRIVDRAALPTIRVLDYDPAADWPF